MLAADGMSKSSEVLHEKLLYMYVIFVHCEKNNCRQTATVLVELVPTFSFAMCFI